MLKKQRRIFTAVAVAALALLIAGCGKTNKLIEGELDNGFTYYIEHNTKPQGKAVFYLVVRVGSTAERDAEQGIAHFIEHMAFNGTKSFDKNELVKYLSEHYGSSFGPDINAHTFFDETVYKLTVPTDREGVIDEVTGILREWADGITFDSDEVSREKGVIIEEWRRGRGAEQRISDKQLALAFEGTIFAERFPIGKVETISAFTADDLRNFYNTWYKSGNMALIAVGDFDSKAVLKAVREKFSSLPAGTVTLPETRYEVPVGEPQFMVNTDSELSRNGISVYIRSNAKTIIENQDDFKNDIEARFIAYMINDRLRSLSSTPRSPLFNPYNGSWTFGHDQFYWIFSSGYRQQEALEAYRLLLQVLYQVQKYGFTAEELERAKTDYFTAFQQQAKESNYIDSQVNARKYTRFFIYGGRNFTREEAFDLYKKVIKDITPEDLHAYYNKIIAGRYYTFLEAPSYEVGTPTAGQLQDVFDNFDIESIEPYEDKTVQGEIFEKPAGRGKVVKEMRYDESIIHWQLSNGINVYLRPSKNTGNTILFSGMAAGGLNKVAAEDYRSAQFSLSLSNESGFGPFDKNELQRVLTGKYVDIAPNLRLYSRGVTGYSAVNDLDVLFRLLLLKTQGGMRYDADAFDRLKERVIQNYSQYEETPEEAFDKVSTEALYGNPYNLYFGLIRGSDLASIDLEKANLFYKRNYNTEMLSSMSYFFAGAIDIEQLKELVEVYLGTLPAAENKNDSGPEIAIPAPDTASVHTAFKGLDPRADIMVAYIFERPYLVDELPYWGIMREMLETRLIETIREELGLVYSPSIFIARLEESDRINLRIINSTDPQYTDEVIQVIDAEVEALLSGAYNADYYGRAVNVLKEQESRARQNDDFWNLLMTTFVQYNLPASDIKRVARQYEKTDSETMQQFFNAINITKERAVAVRLPQASE
jgi:zinc protease